MSQRSVARTQKALAKRAPVTRPTGLVGPVVGITKVDRPIPFNRPSFEGDELAYVAEGIASGHVSGDGPFTRRCRELLEQTLDVPRVLLTTSCTHALEMAALLLDIGPGDEVVVPSFTFVSTINAFVMRGARPRFVDVRPDTLNLDESLLPHLLNSRTRAVVPVHYAGVGCEMADIMRICDARGIAVVEDNAHGLLGRYRGRLLGTFGALAAQSFHETKNFSCGEGGALVINDPALVEPAEIIREKGTNRSRFFRGQVDRYTWVGLGSSYLPSDLLAAILYAQLEARDRIQSRRRRVWNYYHDNLAAWSAEQGVSVPCVPDHCEQSYHMYYLVLPSHAAQLALIAHLKERGIMSVFHYLPLHLSPMGQHFGGRVGECPVTESIADRLVRLPFFNSLDESEQARVVSAVIDFKVQ